MNPQDLMAMAKEIYIRRIAHDPSWDKQKLAREAIESATQFALALQNEKEGSAYPSDVAQAATPPMATPTASTGTPLHSSYSGVQSQGSPTQEGNQQAAGRGMVQQRRSGLGMG